MSKLNLFRLADNSEEEIDYAKLEMTEKDKIKKFKEEYYSEHNDVKSHTLKKQDW